MTDIQAAQVVITTTGVAQSLPNLPFGNQYTPAILAAKSGNAAPIVIGNSSAVTASTGFILAAGSSVPVQLTNANQLWIIGTGADVLSIIGS